MLDPTGPGHSPIRLRTRTVIQDRDEGTGRCLRPSRLPLSPPAQSSEAPGCRAASVSVQSARPIPSQSPEGTTALLHTEGQGMGGDTAESRSADSPPLNRLAVLPTQWVCGAGPPSQLGVQCTESHQGTLFSSLRSHGTGFARFRLAWDPSSLPSFLCPSGNGNTCLTAAFWKHRTCLLSQDHRWRGILHQDDSQSILHLTQI